MKICRQQKQKFVEEAKKQKNKRIHEKLLL